MQVWQDSVGRDDLGLCPRTGTVSRAILRLADGRLLRLRRDNGRYAVAVTLCAMIAACLEDDRQDKASCVLGFYMSV